MDLGYARVSTTQQDLTRQIDALNAEGIDDGRIWVDKKTGATVDRDGLEGLLAYARPGDTVVAHTLDRLGHNIRECLNLIHDLSERDIGVRTLSDPIRIDTRDNSGTGEIAFLMLALFARMDRVFTRERAAHARSIAEKTGRRPGRPRKMTDAQVSRAKVALDAGSSLAEVAADHDVDRSTLYRRVERLRLEEQELRCHDCEALIDSPSVACGNCGQDDPAPTARTTLEEVLAEQPPAIQPDDHGGIASGRSGIAPGSLADQDG